MLCIYNAEYLCNAIYGWRKQKLEKGVMTENAGFITAKMFGPNESKQKEDVL